MTSATHQLRFLRRFISMSVSQAQLQYMIRDQCLVVDKSDKVLTTASKKECHRTPGLLHRAFSLFIFRDSPSYSNTLELLMQRRSDKKLTFPLLWTNSCCSHPCVNYTGESEEASALGVKRAARRKAHHELGIDINECLFVDDIHFLARIHYSAPNEPADGIWCEDEIDYILVAVLPQSLSTSTSPPVHIRPNSEEYMTVSGSGGSNNPGAPARRGASLIGSSQLIEDSSVEEDVDLVGELYNRLEHINPTLPDRVSTLMLESAGVRLEAGKGDARLARLVSVTGEKFLTDILTSAMGHWKISSGQGSILQDKGGPSTQSPAKAASADPVGEDSKTPSKATNAGKAEKRPTLTMEDLIAALRDNNIQVARQPYYQ